MAGQARQDTDAINETLTYGRTYSVYRSAIGV